MSSNAAASARAARAGVRLSRFDEGTTQERVTSMPDLELNFSTKLMLESVKAPSDIDKATRLYDHKNLYKYSTWMKTIKFALKQGEYYSEFQEAWITRQFHPRGPAIAKWTRFYEARLDSSGRTYDNFGTKTVFEDFNDLTKSITDSLFVTEDIFGMVQRYTGRLSITRDEPDTPHNGMELIDYATAAFNLLPQDQLYTESQQISIISGCLPTWMKNRLDFSRPAQPTLATSMDDFRRAVQYMDEEHAEKIFNNKIKRTSRFLSDRRRDHSDRHHEHRRRDHSERRRESSPSSPSRSQREHSDRRFPSRHRDSNRNQRFHPYNKGPDRSHSNSKYSNHSMDHRYQGNPNSRKWNGECAKCGRIGHKIWNCYKATEADKTAFSEKLARKNIPTPMQLDRPARNNSNPPAKPSANH